MNLYFRLFSLFIKSFFKRKGNPETALFETNKISFRVFPFDMDINLHLNNGRYLTLMDLGRTSLLLETGFLWKLVRKNQLPVIAGVQILYRRSFGFLEKGSIETRLIGYDEKWFYIEQIFRKQNGDLASYAIVKGLFQARRKSVPTADIFAAQGMNLPRQSEIPSIVSKILTPADLPAE